LPKPIIIRKVATGYSVSVVNVLDVNAAIMSMKGMPTTNMVMKVQKEKGRLKQLLMLSATEDRH
jgi:hypothetical protein